MGYFFLVYKVGCFRGEVIFFLQHSLDHTFADQIVDGIVQNKTPPLLFPECTEEKNVTKTGVVGSVQRCCEHSQLQIHLNADAKGKKNTRCATRRQKEMHSLWRGIEPRPPASCSLE
jgi:hypothetical protein